MRACVLLLALTIGLYQSCTRTGRTTQRGTDQNQSEQSTARRGEVLFLGNTGKHHDSGKFAPWLAISLFKQGVNLTYTTDLTDLNADNLAKYDGLVIYANHDSLSPTQEQAMRRFVEGGKGLIPLHSASGCFKNSAWYIKAIGGQFKSHGTGSFATTIIDKKHPVTQGLAEFTTS